MAFELSLTNALGSAVIDQPGGVAATNGNFTTLYDYATQYMPELVKDLYLNYGSGKITQFLKATSSTDTYASDYIEHGEQGRLMNILKTVTWTGSTFTSPTAHALRVGDKIRMSNGTTEGQATVASITSSTVFVVTNDLTSAYPTSPVTIIADFSNSFIQGSDPFTTGKTWNPVFYKNYSQIIKETYSVAESKLAQKIWLETPNGPVWVNYDIERTKALFENKFELTQIFHQRAQAGSATVVAGGEPGMYGILETTQTRGNVGTEYIQTIEDLSDIALRIKQQGGCREVTVWSDHKQMAYFRQMMANVNAGYFGGSHYGIFQNSAAMALELNFTSCNIDGVQFHFTPWALLNDPTLYGAADFRQTGLACMIVPMGEMNVSEGGTSVPRPYISVRGRAYDGVDRTMKVDIFGIDGTPQKADKKDVLMLSEQTNQIAGANQLFAITVN